MPVLGVFLLIAAGATAKVNKIILSNRIMIWFGLISYPLYLWHWPLLSFAKIVEGENLNDATRLLMVLISIFLAWLTFRWIEPSLRFGGRVKLKVFTLSFLMVIVGFLGVFVFYKNGFPSRISLAVKNVQLAIADWNYPGDMLKENLNGIDFFVQKTEKRSTTLFVGDSNAEQYYPRILELSKNKSGAMNTVYFKTGSGCFPVAGIKYAQSHHHCKNLIGDANDFIKNKSDIENVVIAGLWSMYFLNEGNGLEQKIGYESDLYRQALLNLENFMRNVVTQGKRVFLIVNIPTAKELAPQYMIYRETKNFPNIFSLREGGVDKSILDEKYGRLQNDLMRAAKNAGAIVINPMDYLCAAKCHALDASGAPIYMDGAHLRAEFVRTQATFIDQTVLD